MMLVGTHELVAAASCSLSCHMNAAKGALVQQRTVLIRQFRSCMSLTCNQKGGIRYLDCTR